MNGRERVLAMMEGRPTDRLPLMPITMMFAGDQIAARYGDYTRDYRVMVEAQLRTAEKFDFDYVSGISDPAREAADCGAHIEYFDNQPPAINENDARLADKTELARLKTPDPLGGGRGGEKSCSGDRERAGGGSPCRQGVDGRVDRPAQSVQVSA